ncbi:ImmA/IrrE family metallo-endopeptidase [Larkinella bovis]|uniref:ImmA/IrrE family metallo-endopeptidase n=1 Tax=Larkinella bovis TaxID=683041 RepID=A0ABW0ID76_9BACT
MKHSLLRRGFKKDAETWSIEIREKLGVEATGACPARCVADLHGVSVTPIQCLSGLAQNFLYDEFPDQQDIDKKMALLLNRNGEFSAVVAIVGGFKMILFNSDHSPARQESDIMHELAHIICEHPGDCLQLNADIALRQYNAQHEEEAKWLGATLQVPDQGLFTLARLGLANAAIADIYGASLEMVVFRRKTLGIDLRLSRLKKFIR